MPKSIFWYDYETTGINPRADRAIQMAGVRTDEALNVIAEPVNLYCRLSEDILPHPMACLVTGITPQTLAEKGLPEAQFIAKVHAELSLPGTCGAGYNTLRFDDEVTRYSLYRNFIDPYAREWQGGNSRWDLIDVVRTAYALRPEGVEWPVEQGQITLKLEALTQANGLAHLKAHDALSDVYATVALAKLIQTKQPKLFDYLYYNRSKHVLLGQITLLKPMVHISGQFGAARHYLAPVLPLAWHPTNRNALIVADLSKDLTPLISEPAQVLKERLYTRTEDLAGQLAVPLKLVHLNKCPVLLPLNIVRSQDVMRLAWDADRVIAQSEFLIAHKQSWQQKLDDIYRAEFEGGAQDPEQQLYEGFITPVDRRLCDQVQQLPAEQLLQLAERFTDKRLPKLLFRYVARNYPAVLSPEQRAQWQVFCQQRLQDEAYGAPLTLAGFNLALQQLVAEADEKGQAILASWQEYVGGLFKGY